MGLAVRRVLIVDDDPGARSLFKAVLSREDCLCTTFATAEEAIDAGDLGRFDVAVIDLRLPGISGAELAWQLRQARANMPIVAVSAYLSRWDRDDLRDLGVDRALSKPFSPEELRNAVADAQAARAGGKAAGAAGDS